MPPPSLLTERAKVAEFYSAGSGTIPPLPWLTFPPPFSAGITVELTVNRQGEQHEIGVKTIDRYRYLKLGTTY
jgi:hypothetical protein